MNAIEIRRMHSDEAEQVAYVNSLAFESNPMFKVIYQSKGEELQKILEKNDIEMYKDWPHETFIALRNGELIQFSVYMTRDQRGAKVVRDLIRHYDGQVTVFRGELTEL